MVLSAAGIVPFGDFGLPVARHRPGPDERSAFGFVLVSVVRGRCPWLSVRVGRWEPAGTDK
jgi:hypothetical protein